MAERFSAAFDGGSRGNPGPAAWAVTLLGADGRVVEGFAGSLGRATNNVAEYHGLIRALEIAAGRGARAVELRSDSGLVVRQMNGEYRVRHPDLRPLFDEAKALAARFAALRIVHVRRESNREADLLVNRALDLAARGDRASEELHVVFTSAPDGP